MDRVGVYVHVPFCERVCPYCDFAVVGVGRLATEREARYVEALLAELEMRRADFAGRPLASLYFGGGTPSLLEPASLARIVEGVRAAFPSGDGVELTLEVNPGTLERDRLPAFREVGVTRVSIGVQSFDDTTLRRLGRAHRAGEALRTLEAARAAGFAALSLDLILAAPGQRLADLRREIDAALAHAPEHLSLYELTIETGTPFETADARGQLDRPPEEEIAEMLVAAGERLESAGLARYELSSYARPGFEAVHNRRYWQRRPVLGLGVGAVSNDPASAAAPHGSRRTNLRDPAAYQRALAEGRPPVAAADEVLAAAVARGEAAFLALRTREGLDAARFAQEFGAPPRHFWKDSLDALVAAGLLAEAPGGDLGLTSRGRLLADTVFAHFV